MNQSKKQYRRDRHSLFTPIVYDNMDESLILKAAVLTKRGSGPSGLDADGQRKILISRSFGRVSSELHRMFTLFVKRLWLDELRNTESLKSFIACRLIPLDKRPRLRPIRVGGVLRRVAGKAVMIRYNYVEGKLPDLKPRYMQCMISSMMTTQQVFYLQMQRMPLVRSIEGYASQLEIPLVEENYYLSRAQLLSNYQALKTTGSN